MEPIKINIEVNLGEATLAALGKLLSPSVPAAKPEAKKEPEKASKKPEKATAPEPAPAPQPEPVKTALGDDDDLPADDAPAPEKEAKIPTEAEMRAAIQATRKRGVPAKTIKDYIRDTFGVETSVECPEAKRQDLIDGLASLAA